MASPVRKPQIQKVAKAIAAKTSTELAKEVDASGMVIIANHHTAPFLFPCTMMQGVQRVQLEPIVLLPGQTTTILKDEWVARKKLKVIQHYIDAGLLSESKRQGECATQDYTTDTENLIPDSLLNDSEGKQTGLTASVKRAKIGSIEVD